MMGVVKGSLRIGIDWRGWEGGKKEPDKEARKVREGSGSRRVEVGKGGC